jgi:hypothetical protein
MALGLQLCAGVVGGRSPGSRGRGIEGSQRHLTLTGESPMKNTMRKWGDEVLLFVAVVAIGVLIIVF